ASRPSRAVITVKPSFSRMVETRRRIAGSSSATRIFPFETFSVGGMILIPILRKICSRATSKQLRSLYCLSCFATLQRQFRGQLNRRNHARMLGNSLSGNVESSAMIDGRTDKWQAQGYVNSFTE